MDLDEWDLLSDEGFLGDGKDINLFSKKTCPNATAIDMNYFQKFSEPQNSRVIHVPIQFEEIPDEIIKLPIETTKHDDHDHDHEETVSQVFFKKMKENEFVDMKMDSPKSLNRGMLPQIDVGPYQDMNSGNYEKVLEEQEQINKEVREISNDEGLSVWKWAMNGMGAVFSFGFAAVSVSLIVLGNRHKESANNSKKHLHFQFYNHDKKVKQEVNRDTKFNEAITVMRGAPVTGAHITIGGYYEGL